MALALYIHITRCDYDTYFEEVFENIFDYGSADKEVSVYKRIELEEWLSFVKQDAEMSLTNLHDAFWTGASTQTLYGGEEYLFQYNDADETGCNAISIRSPDEETLAKAAKVAEALKAQIIFEGSDKQDELGRLRYDFRRAAYRERYKALLAKKEGGKKPWWKVW